MAQDKEKQIAAEEVEEERELTEEELEKVTGGRGECRYTGRDD